MNSEIERVTLDSANRDCLAKRKPGEPVFIILGRDPDGGNLVRLWAERRKAAGGDPEHYEPVFAIADAMDVWRANGNLPDSAPKPEDYPPSLQSLLAQAQEALPIFERVTRLAHTLSADVPVTSEALKHIDAAYAALAALQPNAGEGR